MTSEDIWNELLNDVRMNHSTEPTRMLYAFTVLASRRTQKKGMRGHAAEALFKEFEEEARAINGFGLLGRDPDVMYNDLIRSGRI